MNFLEILRNRLAELVETRSTHVAELEAITSTAEVEARAELDEDETAAFEAARSAIETVDADIDQVRSRITALEEIEARRQRVEDAGIVEGPQVRRDPGDVWDVSNISVLATRSELRGRAVTAIEQIEHLDDVHRSRAVEMIERNDSAGGALARRILATGHPDYRSGAQKIMGGAQHLLNDDERNAVMRAASLANADGGYAIPFTLDPTIIMTNNGAANPFRQISRVESIVTDSWNGISSAGVSGGYAAEASEVDDDAPTLAQPSVSPERWDVFVPFSFEIGQDWVTIEEDIRMMVDEKRDEFDLDAFTSGTGTNEPFGVITGLTSGASEIGPVTSETFAASDLYKLEGELGPKYRRTGNQAAWMMALGTINQIRQFDTQGGSALIARLDAGVPDRLLGYRLFENSAMDSSVDINPSADDDNYIAVLGDWRNFLIVDRVGMNFELVPHLFAANANRPSGQRGFLAWGRTGSKVVNINAFKMLSIPTSS